jgi:ABC-type Mn2+/Zn2+ transport system ATPase subunit
MQGAGKTSLLKAMLGQVKERNSTVLECIHVDLHGKGISNGLCYIDSTTVNLQVLLLPFVLLICSVKNLPLAFGAV